MMWIIYIQKHTQNAQWVYQPIHFIPHDASGALNSADDIQWYNDVDDDAPTETTSTTTPLKSVDVST